MQSRKEFAIKFVAKEKAELVPVETNTEPLKPREVAGHTLVSLVSSGTETVGCYAGTLVGITESSYPMGTGYAAVFQVEQVGSEVTSIAKGDVVFVAGSHRSFQRADEEQVVKVPVGLDPETAIFTRMAKISMPALARSEIRPPEIMIVTGLGVVGMMAAQIGQIFGYQVLGCDPSEKRRRIAQEHGIRATATGVPLTDPQYQKKVGLGLECSGHEQAALDLCNVARVWGEVALVGVPWTPRTSLLAQKVLYAVFSNYVNLKTGWEWQMPADPAVHSHRYHLETAMRWLAEGKLKVSDGAFRRTPPTDPQKNYQDILHGQLDELTVLFDWRQL